MCETLEGVEFERVLSASLFNST